MTSARERERAKYMKKDNIIKKETSKTDLMILQEEKARIERRCKAKRLPHYKVEEVGGYVKNDEIFVQVVGYPKYYISNYGRAISLKKNSLPRLMKPQRMKCNKYTYYRMYNASHKNGTNIYVHRAVAEAFCPNLYRDLSNDPNDVHHMNHGKRVNRPDNLLWLPRYLHLYCNFIGKFGIWREKTARNLHPLELVEQTGLDLKDIIFAVKQEPIKKVGKWSIYNVQGHMIALELLSEISESGKGFKMKSSKVA